MPFTFSHPAIILPIYHFYKKRLSLTGLVIGSIIPDFEYFIRMKIKSIHSHTLTGIFYFDLPLGILVAIIFHSIVRKPLVENSPLFIKRRLLGIGENWMFYFKNHWLIVTISIILGSCSHIFWDSFTRHNGLFVDNFPIFKTLFLDIPLYKILQHSSSVVGIIIISLYIKHLPIKKTNTSSYYKYWLYVGCITFAFISLRLSIENVKSGHLIVTTISSLLLSLIVVSWFFKHNSKMQRTK